MESQLEARHSEISLRSAIIFVVAFQDKTKPIFNSYFDIILADESLTSDELEFIGDKVSDIADWFASCTDHFNQATFAKRAREAEMGFEGVRVGPF